MPPRILLQPSLRALTGPSSVQLPFAALSLNPAKTSVRAGSTESRERRRHDPFLMAQSRQRKAANISRQKALTKEREGSVGDPVQSEPTPFIQELRKTQATLQDTDLNYFVTPDGLNEAMEYSKNLTSPIRNPDRDTADPQLEKEAAEKHLQEHRNAQEAIRRIVSVANGNTKDHMRLHIQKCIETFGRHKTDSKTPRVGPDTGSPEVQVAILTAKIMNLSRHLQTTKKDRHNKRNLRLLVHKRQKLLRYLRRKERGGPRWQNLMEKLGLSEAAWKGEISM
ncbi:mitochondrial 37S ribosomal protein uS15m [Aspergillus niger]|uniref:Contig An02c0270, genomic contig n=2 Tax=Aspergillus niger TaxID=5061 RepID=A2QE31_ASPNC|nr:uncharacterized protein An02g09190 [Aspergillus niger]CAK44327.1 unnamed protein product [Aspergillus niger]